MPPALFGNYDVNPLQTKSDYLLSRGCREIYPFIRCIPFSVMIATVNCMAIK